MVDPRRDIEVYLDLAESNGLDINYIFETHRNEDYVIGSLELAEATGAEIFHGKNLNFQYGTPASEGNIFHMGTVELEVLETPGHTLESISLAVRDLSASDDVQMVFTGDVIFAGETGRIDFYGIDRRPEMARLLYESIFQKILPLGDGVILCPAHGAGSVCGADIREQDYTTVGYEKKTNPQLQFVSKDDFVDFKISEELYTPPYFKKMEFYNQNGVPALGMFPHLRPMPVKFLKDWAQRGAQVLDVRKPTSYAGGHIPGSLNIWEEGVAAFAGWFLNYEDPIILVDDQSHGLLEVKLALARLGFDNIHGYLANGFPSWYLHAEHVDKLNLWTVHDLKKHQDDSDLFLLDVRKIDDWKKGYIEGAHHIYLGEIPLKMKEIPHDIPLVVYCDSGYKSTIACSFLKNNGYTHLTSVVGSMTAWEKAGYPVMND
ncbi:MBL fold hydrolase [Methanobacterium ferruginis]|nr:MBL fold hydrolase [Methanobacterium ferruginis]